MNSKIILLAMAFLGLCMFSCKNAEENEGYDAVSNTGTEVSPVDSGVLKEDGAENEMETKTEPANMDEDSKVKTADKTVTGQYIKVGDEVAENCSCYCVDITFESTSKLCLVPDKMAANVRFERHDNNINVFLVSPVPSKEGGKDIPWDQFDKNKPIAQITPQSNGELKLDWLGFTINNDLAIDYAIYGKKTLEGIYKKK